MEIFYNAMLGELLEERHMIREERISQISSHIPSCTNELEKKYFLKKKELPLILMEGFKKSYSIRMYGENHSSRSLWTLFSPKLSKPKLSNEGWRATIDRFRQNYNCIKENTNRLVKLTLLGEKIRCASSCSETYPRCLRGGVRIFRNGSNGDGKIYNSSNNSTQKILQNQCRQRERRLLRR